MSTLVLLIFIFASTVFHHVMVAIEKGKYMPPGKMIEIDRHEMHIHGRGQGVPTVVMTCGSGAPSAYTEYSLIAPAIAKTTRTCVYERPGYGWSEFAETSRDTGQIVKDLHRLLEKAGEKPPYIFVAHSMGAMEVLLYAHNYPGEVAGMVLIDGTSPYKHIHYSKSSIPFIAMYTMKILNWLGIIRIAGSLGVIPLLTKRLQSMPKDIRAIERAMIYKNMLNRMVLREGDILSSVAKKMEGQLNLGDMPLIIYAADHSLEKLPGWKESQESLCRLSTRSKMMVVKNSNHISILQDHVETIIEGIQEILTISESI